MTTAAPRFNGGIIDEVATLDHLGLKHWLIYWWEDNWRTRTVPGTFGGVLTLQERDGSTLVAAEFGVGIIEITQPISDAIQADINRKRRRTKRCHL